MIGQPGEEDADDDRSLSLLTGIASPQHLDIEDPTTAANSTPVDDDEAPAAQERLRSDRHDKLTEDFVIGDRTAVRNLTTTTQTLFKARNQSVLSESRPMSYSEPIDQR